MRDLPVEHLRFASDAVSNAMASARETECSIGLKGDDARKTTSVHGLKGEDARETTSVHGLAPVPLCSQVWSQLRWQGELRFRPGLRCLLSFVEQALVACTRLEPALGAGYAPRIRCSSPTAGRREALSNMPCWGLIAIKQTATGCWMHVERDV